MASVPTLTATESIYEDIEIQDRDLAGQLAVSESPTMPRDRVKLLSEVLTEQSGFIDADELQNYREVALVLQKKQPKTTDDELFISDFMEHVLEARVKTRQAPGTPTPTLMHSSAPPLSRSQRPTPIRLNELVLKPDTFNGKEPMPRVWLDSYERSARANG